MRLLRFLKRAVLALALAAFVLLAGVSVYLRIEQYRFRRQAEQLLADVRGLELNKASAAEVRSVVKKWGFTEWGKRQISRGTPAPTIAASTVLNSCRTYAKVISRTLSFRHSRRNLSSGSGCV